MDFNKADGPHTLFVQITILFPPRLFVYAKPLQLTSWNSTLLSSIYFTALFMLNWHFFMKKTLCFKNKHFTLKINFFSDDFPCLMGQFFRTIS